MFVQIYVCTNATKEIKMRFLCDNEYIALDILNLPVYFCINAQTPEIC